MTQVKIRHLLLPLLIAILVFVGYLLNYVGAFRPVSISEKKAGPFLMLYKDHAGPYHKIVAVIEEVETWAKKNGLACKLSFGEYLDDPNSVEEPRLRSHGGCIVTPEERLPASLPEGFKSQILLEKNYVTAVFEGSPGIGPMKVYPKIRDYFAEHSLQSKDPNFEVYEVHGQQAMTTTYYFPLVTPAKTVAMEFEFDHRLVADEARKYLKDQIENTYHTSVGVNPQHYDLDNPKFSAKKTEDCEGKPRKVILVAFAKRQGTGVATVQFSLLPKNELKLISTGQSAISMDEALEHGAEIACEGGE